MPTCPATDSSTFEELNSWSCSPPGGCDSSQHSNCSLPRISSLHSLGAPEEGGAHRSADSGSQAETPQSARCRRAGQSVEQGALTLREIKGLMLADAKVQDEAIPIICDVLEETIRRNDRTRLPPAPALEGFEGDTWPVSAASYVKRIIKCGGCSTCCLVAGLLYLERLKARQRQLRITSSNLQRLLLVAVMTAAKFFDNIYYSNSHWAQIGGITSKEINALELDFLFCMTFDLGVSTTDYKEFLQNLLSFEDSAADADAPKSPQQVARRKSSTTAKGKNDSWDNRLTAALSSATTPLTQSPSGHLTTMDKGVVLPEIGKGGASWSMS
mmetsp:Transcript_53355/g.130357  ORF Transcript_53355/g.130357 Transcript_53355/m.130357 type:complete len:328 (+) Transcript_53355:319-1302(+)